MPMYFPPWDMDVEPNESNIKTWMDNLYGKFEPIEQARWNQANIDTLFYAGEQRFINSYFNFYPQYNWQTFQFNLVQQPVNMVTGYQRQHRKSVNFTPIEGSKQEFADDLTNIITYANSHRGILDKMSTAYEQSAIAGMVLVQPYLDYTDDPVNGTLDLKVWSYNSFLVDPYFREPDMSDCNFIWCQQYISKQEAKNYFPDKADVIGTMSGYGNRYGKFYFLPENYNLARNDLLVLSYVWYHSKRKKKMLYNHNDGMAYEYVDKDEHLDDLLKSTGFFEIIEVEVPTWKLAVVINDQVMYLSYNPLGFDECPLIPVYWNYDPHIAQYDLRVRSLVRVMRDSQFLMNRRIILNHDISESSINSGWILKENSVADEDNLSYSGQGKNVHVKPGYEIGDVQKIIPNAVPPSDMQLADQLADLIFRTSGINQELLGMSDDSNTGIEVMLRQGAGLVTLQKYFDQWDLSLRLLGRLEQRIVQNKWSPAKIGRILGREPNVEFLAKTFSKYDVLVSEGVNTTIQAQQQFLQLLKMNEILGGVIPPKFILKHATIQGKNEIIAALEETAKEQKESQQQELLLRHSVLEAQLQNLQAKSTGEIAMARERHGRAESNIGLFEERLSEITHNRSMALKAKVEALEKLVQLMQQYGPLEALQQMGNLERLNINEEISEDRAKVEAKQTSQSHAFMDALLNTNAQQQQQMSQQQQMGPQQEGVPNEANEGQENGNEQGGAGLAGLLSGAA
jgi:hypothetical protein